MSGFVIEATGGERLVEFHNAAIKILDGSARRVPPVGVNHHVSERPESMASPWLSRSMPVWSCAYPPSCSVCMTANESTPDALRRPRVCTRFSAPASRGPETPHTPNAHDAAAAQFDEVQRVIGFEGRVGVPARTNPTLPMESTAK